MKNINYYPEKPTHESLNNAYHLLINTYTVCEDFLELYDEIINKRDLVDVKEIDRKSDLLRAALLFASSGLDSFVKQLVRDSLYNVVQENIGAQQRLKNFVEKRLEKNDSLNTKELSDALLSVDPRKYFIKCLIYELTDRSLQSKEELLNVASYFDIPSQDIVDNFNYLRDVFQIRNQITHEMDFDHITNERRPRDKKEMLDAIDYLFNVSCKLLCCVNKKLVISL